MVEQLIVLGRVEIPADNTPVKSVGGTLYPTPRWRYKGPARTITIHYQVGRWGVGGFAGDTERITETLNQPTSDYWQEFSPTTPLRGVKLIGLKASPDNRYDMELVMGGAGLTDQSAIFTDCCEVPAVAAELEIVGCRFS